MSKRYGCSVRGVGVVVVVMVMLVCVCGSASAADEEISISDLKVGLDTVWVLLGAFLVFFMQAGFGMLEAGFIRAKNTCNILTKNFLDFCMASLGFFLDWLRLDVRCRQRFLWIQGVGPVWC